MNLNYQFYKGYYQDFDPCWFEDTKRKEALESGNENAFKTVNNRLFGYVPSQEVLNRMRFERTRFGSSLLQFPLRTTYPGLLSGTGYTHETGQVGEFKIGFYFDHTSGLPILPGHSVKGALRSAFPRREMPRTTEDPLIKAAKAELIIQLLKLEEDLKSKNRYDWVHALEMQIFSGQNPVEGDQRTPKDVFLDAVIIRGGQGGKIVGPDAITPHEKESWKNPNPLPFLKVLPEVTWEFSFMLHETAIDGIKVTAEAKKNLFKAILLELGIGAKTNVGYGQFEEVR